MARSRSQADGSGNQPATVIEPYSSQGPTQATPQAASRIKPDVTATDGVSVTGAGGFGTADTLNSLPCPLNNPSPPGCHFFGSSAAAPHAAAIAALTLQSAACLLSSSTINKPATARANLRNFITSTATPLPGIAQAVPNNIEGFGLVNALNAITATLPTVKAGSDQTITGTGPNGVTVNFSGSASDPDSCPVTLSWSGSCGTAAGATASLTCPIGNNTETLRASNGGATASLPTGTVHVSVSDFSVAAQQSTATVQAGQPATYTLSVGSQFGAFSNPVSLACSGAPSLASCSLSAPSLTPPPTSTLTITTTAPSSYFPLVEPRIPNLRLFVLWLCLSFSLSASALFSPDSRTQ